MVRTMSKPRRVLDEDGLRQALFLLDKGVPNERVALKLGLSISYVGKVKVLRQLPDENTPSLTNDDKHLLASERHSARYPEKIKARQAVTNALKTGKLVRPEVCENCGHFKPQGHHDDYTKPLDVRWLCVSCHMEHHKNERQGTISVTGQDIADSKNS